MPEEKTNSNQSYYTISPDLSDNADGENFPLFVNCAGEASTKQKIRNDNKKGRNDYYLMYMQSGTLDLSVGGERHSFMSGQMICMSPHTPYSYDNYESEEPLRYYWIHFTGKSCEELLAMCALPVCEVVTVGLHSDVATYFESLFSEFRNRQSNFQFAIGLKAQYILFLLARYRSSRKEADTPLDKSIRYIHGHIKEKLPVSELADMEFLSVSRYRELFRRVTGQSPSEYITRLRIHSACDLLEQGVSLSRAAELSGYTDRLYFQRVFKRIMGITPGEYRNRYH